MENQLERLLLRLHFHLENGLSILYVYDRETLMKLQLEQDSFTKLHYLKVGELVVIDDRQYRITDMALTIEDSMIHPEVYGVNINAATDPVPYNTTLTMAIRRVKRDSGDVF